jgi:hypothetical protein
VLDTVLVKSDVSLSMCMCSPFSSFVFFVCCQLFDVDIDIINIRISKYTKLDANRCCYIGIYICCILFYLSVSEYSKLRFDIVTI